MAPEADEAVPAAQAVHCALPGEDAYLPAPHCEHEVAPRALWYQPAAQGAQDVLFAEDAKEPGLQSEQPVLPGVFE